MPTMLAFAPRKEALFLEAAHGNFFDARMLPFAGFALLSAMLAILVTLYWMLVAWRAIKAHERLASSVAGFLMIAMRQNRLPGERGEQ